MRPFLRNHDGLQITLRLEDWPGDMPLPDDTAIVGIGENHELLVLPYWKFILEPTRTIEKFSGWFRFPLKLAEARQWYLAELSKRGWVV